MRRVARTEKPAQDAPQVGRAAVASDWPHDVSPIEVTVPYETNELVPLNLAGGGDVAIAAVGQRPTAWRRGEVVDGRLAARIANLPVGIYFVYARATEGAVRRAGTVRVR